jgi:uncharacterized protein YaiL (DUF2058 family)
MANSATGQAAQPAFIHGMDMEDKTEDAKKLDKAEQLLFEKNDHEAATALAKSVLGSVDDLVRAAMLDIKYAEIFYFF